MAKMTPKERETTMLNGENPDRMMIWQINGIVAAHSQGYMWKDVRGDAKLSVDLMRKFARNSGTDVLGHTCIEPNAPYMDLPGVDVKFADDNYSNVMSHYFNEPEDVDNKELFDPFNKKEAKNLWKYLLDKTTLMAKEENDYLVQNVSWSVMTTAGFLRNVEALLMDVIVEPELAHKILKRAAGLVDGMMCAGLAGGCDTAYLADPTGSGSLVSGDTYEEFCSPHVKKLVKKFKDEYKAPTYIHMCGESLPIAEPVSKVGAALFSFDYMTDIVEMKKIMGNDIIMAGNLDPMNVVWMGSPENVIDVSKRCIEQSEGARFALATGCETPRDTPIENLQAMLTAVEKYGRY